MSLENMAFNVKEFFRSLAEDDMSLSEQAKAKAVEQFCRRKGFASQKRQDGSYPDNDRLDAGSPMYFYCMHCGILIEKLPEDYLFRPLQLCSQCKGLKEQGWLGEAKMAFDRSCDKAEARELAETEAQVQSDAQSYCENVEAREGRDNAL
jgi:hypothetical protein